MTRKLSTSACRWLFLLPALFYSLSLPAQKKSMHGKYSFINRLEDSNTRYYLSTYEGKKISDVKFEDVYSSTNDFNFFSIVKKDGKWGVIDPQGKTLVPFAYDAIEGFHTNDLDFELWGYRQTKPLSEIKGYFIVKCGNFKGVIDPSGKELVPCKYSNLMVWGAKEVAYVVDGKISLNSDHQWGMVDFKGNILVPLEYRMPYTFGRPYLLQDTKGKYGSFDAEGKECLPFLYDAFDATDVSILKKNGKWGVILACTAESLPFNYDSIISITGPGYYAALKDGKWKVFNVDGDTPLQSGADHDAVVVNNNGDGLNYIVKDGSQWQLVDGKGKMLKLLGCEQVKACSDVPYYFFHKNGKCGLYSEKCEILIPADYDSIAESDLEQPEGFARIYRNGKCGIYNTRLKKEDLTCLFDNVDIDSYVEAYYMHSHFIPVTAKGTKKIYINDPKFRSFGNAINIDNFILACQTETSIKEWLWYVYSRAQGESPDPNDLPDTNKLNPLCRIAFRYRGGENEEYETMKITPSFSRSWTYVRFPKGKRKELEAILDYPVTGISFEQVNAFCSWATGRLEEDHYYDGVNMILRLPEITEWEQIARKGFRTVEVPNDRHDSINDKGCMLFRYKADKGCPFYDNMIKLRGNETVKVWDFNQDMDGLYDVFGNVAEMTAIQGSAKGGSYVHYAKNSKAGDTISYSGAEPWLGFRYIIEFKQQ